MFRQWPQFRKLGVHGDWLQEPVLGGLEAVVGVVVAVRVGVVLVAPSVGGPAGQVRRVAQGLLVAGGVT